MQRPFMSANASINGISLYYEIHGEGYMPLVLIHGGGSTIETSFGNLLPLLTGKLIAVELQAHGRTSDRDAPETFEQDADDVAALMKQLKIDKANFLGFSNGGTTTLQIAIRHPELVNKIVVIAGAYKRNGFIPGFFEGMDNVTIENMPAPLQEAYLKLNPGNQSGLLRMFEKDRQRMIGFKDMKEEDLEKITAPALLMVADKDVITAEHTLGMSKLLPNGQLAILPGIHGSFIGEVCTIKKDSKLIQVTATLVEEFLAIM